MTTYLAIALVLCLLAIFAQLIGDAIRQSNRRHSKQLAETDRDWRDQVPPNWQTPHGQQRVGLDEERAA